MTNKCISKIACLLLLLVSLNLSAQANKLADSLLTELKKFEAKKLTYGNSVPEMHDTIKVHLLRDISMAYYGNDINKMSEYAVKMLTLSKRLNYNFGIADAMNMQGMAYELTSEYDKALAIYIKTIPYYSSKPDDGYISLLNNIGVLYIKKGIFTEALRYLYSALKIAEKTKSEKGLISTYNNIGIVFDKQNRPQEALKQYLKSLAVQLKGSKYAISFTYNNIGEIYSNEKKYDKAMPYYENGVRYARIENNNESLANNYSGIGNIYRERKRYDKAREYHTIAMDIRLRSNDEYGLFTSYINLGGIYLELNETQKALSYTQKAFDIVIQHSQLDMITETYRQFAEIYKRSGNYAKAYENHELYKQYNDSVFNAENEKKLVEQQLNFEFNAIQEKKDLAAKEAIAHQKYIRNLQLAGAVLIGLFIVGFLIRRHRVKQKALRNELTIKDLEAKALKNANENIQLKNNLITLENEFEKGEKEKLREKLDFNQRQLASTTLYLAEKNKMLSELQDEIDALPKTVTQGSDLSKVKSVIQRNLYLDDDWEKFRLHFEQVHPNFFKELEQKHPGLTAYEVRLYTYLHMKLSTKEIAALLNITPASVIKAKVRLNKKLRLAGETDTESDETEAGI